MDDKWMSKTRHRSKVMNFRRSNGIWSKRWTRRLSSRSKWEQEHTNTGTGNNILNTDFSQMLEWRWVHTSIGVVLIGVGLESKRCLESHGVTWSWQTAFSVPLVGYPQWYGSTLASTSVVRQEHGSPVGIWSMTCTRTHDIPIPTQRVQVIAWVWIQGSGFMRG